MASIKASCIWCRVEECNGKVYSENKRQDTECFDDHFPCRKEKFDRQHVNNWLKMFVLYLHMGMNRIRFMKFLLIRGG
jgi:hypothetical protein